MWRAETKHNGATSLPKGREARDQEKGEVRLDPQPPHDQNGCRLVRSTNLTRAIRYLVRIEQPHAHVRNRGSVFP